MIKEITEDEAKKLLAQKWGLFEEKKFKGSMFEGKYIAHLKNKWFSCGKLSEAAKIFGLV